MAGKKTGSRNSVLLTRAEGANLAFDMLRAMEGRAVECSLLLEQCTGRQQDNVVLRFLDVLRQDATREAEDGFTRVVTDFLSGALNEGYRPMIEPKGEPATPAVPARTVVPSNVIPFPRSPRA